MGPPPKGRSRSHDDLIHISIWPASMGPPPKGRSRVDIGGHELFELDASMGPPPKGRSRSTTGALPSLRWGFNGAAPEGAEQDARRTGFAVPVPRLQWGRPRRGGAGKGYMEVGAWLEIASMGPPPKGRSRHRLFRDVDPNGVASMGPPPKGRSRSKSLGFLRKVRPLQWGRPRRGGAGSVARSDPGR